MGGKPCIRGMRVYEFTAPLGPGGGKPNGRFFPQKIHPKRFPGKHCQTLLPDRDVFSLPPLH
ncbi:MAG: DUF433 domain-containing protein [Deltaproteobacteria bacterium]|nr:DUF433 domain-containing protein [Deltaproteobacteria bacterium]